MWQDFYEGIDGQANAELIRALANENDIAKLFRQVEIKT
jgi:hypothetical protein